LLLFNVVVINVIVIVIAIVVINIVIVDVNANLNVVDNYFDCSYIRLLQIHVT